MKPVKNRIKGFMVGAQVMVVRDMGHRSIQKGMIGRVVGTTHCSHWPNCGDDWINMASCPGYMSILFLKEERETAFQCWGYNDRFALEPIILEDQ
jgi:hypothetical protein